MSLHLYPPKKMMGILTPRTCEIGLYLEIVFADVTKLKCSHAGLKWTPIQYELCPHKKRKEDKGDSIMGRWREETWGDVSTSQGTPGLPAPMRSKEKAWTRVSLRVQMEPVLPTP